MYHSPSKRKKRAQLTFIYSLMVLAVISIVAALVLVMQGYRFNQYDGKVEQGGLVQFNSRPTGATVTVDDIQLANKTASKITLSAGNHTITMAREGYTSWTKDVTVVPGSVLWLNYARLFPVKPIVQPVAALSAADNAVASPNKEQLAIFATQSEPTLTIVRLNDDTPEVRAIAITSGVFTAPATEASQAFAVVDWSSDNRHVIVKHNYDDKTEYLAIDTRGNDESKNISRMLGINAIKIEYALGESNVVYALTDTGDVRRADIGSSTLSGPLVTNVVDFDQYDNSTLTFETRIDPAAKSRTVGYLTEGASKPRVVRSYTDDGQAPLKMRIGEYYGDRYVALAYGDNITVLTGDLPSSDADAKLSLARVASLTLPGGAAYLDFSPNENRFVYAQQGSTVLTYDMELKQVANSVMAQPMTRGVDWVDSFHFVSVANGAMTHYDFDGKNGHAVAASVIDRPVTLSGNGKYLYYFTPTETGISLVRNKLTID